MSSQRAISPLVGTHTLNPTADPAVLVARAECTAAEHQPITYNPIHDATWCRCGTVVVAGNHGKPSSTNRMPPGGWGALARDGR